MMNYLDKNNMTNSQWMIQCRILFENSFGERAQTHFV